MDHKTYTVDEYMIDIKNDNNILDVEKIIIDHVGVKPGCQVDIIFRTRSTVRNNGTMDTIRIRHGGITYSEDPESASPMARVSKWFDGIRSMSMKTRTGAPRYYIKIIVKRQQGK